VGGSDRREAHNQAAELVSHECNDIVDTAGSLNISACDYQQLDVVAVEGSPDDIVCCRALGRIAGHAVGSHQNAQFQPAASDLRDETIDGRAIHGCRPVLALKYQIVRQKWQAQGMALVVEENVNLGRSRIVRLVAPKQADPPELTERLMYDIL